MRPLLFLDFDDVVCLNSPYGGYDVMTQPWPEDLFDKLWHPRAMAVLQAIVSVFSPQVVVTSSWLRFMPLSSIAALLRRSGAAWLAEALHPAGEALQAAGQTRAQAIDDWLLTNHQGQAYVVLDDPRSGTGLAGSLHDRQGRLVLCDVDVGLLSEHSTKIRSALSKPLGP